MFGYTNLQEFFSIKKTFIVGRGLLNTNIEETNSRLAGEGINYFLHHNCLVRNVFKDGRAK